MSSTAPAHLATGIAPNSAVVATFSTEMDPATITAASFTLAHGDTPVTGVVTYSGVTATFTPTGNLDPDTLHTATITTGAKDLSGKALAVNKVWTFTTGSEPDTAPPTVISTIPADVATDAATNSAVTATFSEAMAPSTITPVTFTLEQGSTPVEGAVTHADVTV